MHILAIKEFNGITLHGYKKDSWVPKEQLRVYTL